MINQIDNKWWFRVNSALRKTYVRGYLSPFFDSYIITEYPKSGGTWLSQLLSTSLDISYPRNRLPVFDSSVIHGCFLNSGKKNKTIVLNRDGRDIMVSFYYHSLVKKPRVSDNEVDRITKDLDITDVSDIKSNLPRFIDYCFANRRYPYFTWTDFVNKWHNNPSVVHTSYEALNKDTVTELQKILTGLGAEVPLKTIREVVDQFSFEKQTNRKKGQEDPGKFLRKGIVGDWKNSFTRESSRLFDQYAGDELILLGYEQDHSWTKE